MTAIATKETSKTIFTLPKSIWKTFEMVIGSPSPGINKMSLFTSQITPMPSIAPATANIIGKIAHGIADDFLSTVVMAAANQAPIYIAPAMNTNMYENPIVQENIEKLKSLGYQFIEPKESMLACGTLGKGALADVDVIVDIVEGSMK